MKKKILFMLVLFVTVASKAQIVYDVNYGRMEFQVGNAWYSCADLPGGAHVSRGDNVMNVVNNYFIRLRHDDPEAYVREYNSWTMRGGLAGVQPVRYSTATMGGMMMGGGAMMGGMMVGTGMNNSGMVMGSTGMAGATSNVIIDNSNLAETIGSGITMNYDTGSNSLSVSGDPITAGLRFFTAIGSKTKKNRNRQQTYANGQILQDANGNQYVVNNGVLVPVKQTRTNTTTSKTNGQVTYNVSAGGFVSGF